MVTLQSSWFNLLQLLIASNANVGGPATAAAMASARRWQSLVSRSSPESCCIICMLLESRLLHKNFRAKFTLIVLPDTHDVNYVFHLRMVHVFQH